LKEVGEEKKKKEALRVEREEVEDKRKHDEEVQKKQQQEVIKARAVVTPVQVGKIDLNPKTCSCSSSCGRGKERSSKGGFGS
jgi:translation initiation factor IF-2